jgi:hypothetical protein
MHRVLLGVIASLLLGLACGPTAAPAPAAPAGGASSAAPSAPVSDAAYRQQVIDAARAAGFPSFSWADHPDLLAFAVSPEGDALAREIDQILKGG